jgi:hypothetical protein
MNKILEDHCDTIDAAVFTGDFLENASHRKDLKEFCERWLREIERFEEMDREEKECRENRSKMKG